MSRIAKVGEYVRFERDTTIDWTSPPEGMEWPKKGEIFQIREITSKANIIRYLLDRRYPNGDQEWHFHHYHFVIVEKRIDFTDIFNPQIHWVVVDN